MGQLLKRVLDDNDVARAVRRVAHEIVEGNRGADDIVLIGIPTRGVPLAERVGGEIAAIEGVAVPVGTLDIGAYRDDLATRQVQDADRTDIGVPIDGRTVVLVDDVLYTGRTVRAALDALADVGRPARIQLAVLVDRGHRELPIRADYVGKNLPTSENERVTVHLTEADADEGVWIEERRS